MGTWNTGILQNDTTANTWVEFKMLYNQGLSPKDIRVILEEKLEPQKNKEYYGEIWTAIAHGQWMCGELEEYTLKKVKASTDQMWLTLWAEDEKSLQQRLKVLDKFIVKIQTPRSSKLKRKKIVDRPSFFKTGDVIGIKVNDESYLAALVVEHSYGGNRIIITDLLFREIPSIKEVLEAQVLYLDVGGQYYYYRGYYEALYNAKNMVKKIKNDIKVGEVNVKKYLSLGFSLKFGDWNKISEHYKEQIEFLKKHKSDKPYSVTISEILNPKKDLEDMLLHWSKEKFRERLTK